MTLIWFWSPLSFSRLSCGSRSQGIFGEHPPLRALHPHQHQPPPSNDQKKKVRLTRKKILMRTMRLTMASVLLWGLSTPTCTSHPPSGDQKKKMRLTSANQGGPQKKKRWPAPSFDDSPTSPAPTVPVSGGWGWRGRKCWQGGWG